MVSKHYFAVEKVVDHEDGSATYQVYMGDDTRNMFIEDGVRLVLMCAVAEISVEDAFDIIHNIAKERLKENVEGPQNDTS